MHTSVRFRPLPLQLSNSKAMERGKSSRRLNSKRSAVRMSPRKMSDLRAVQISRQSKLVRSTPLLRNIKELGAEPSHLKWLGCDLFAVYLDSKMWCISVKLSVRQNVVWKGWRLFLYASSSAGLMLDQRRIEYTAVPVREIFSLEKKGRFWSEALFFRLVPLKAVCRFRKTGLMPDRENTL